MVFSLIGRVYLGRWAHESFFLRVCTCRSLEEERSRRYKAELETFQCKFELQTVNSQFGRVKQELQVSMATVSLYSKVL